MLSMSSPNETKFPNESPVEDESYKVAQQQDRLETGNIRKRNWRKIVAVTVGVGALAFAVGVSIAYIVFELTDKNDRFDALPELLPIPETWRSLTLPQMHIRCSHNSYLSGTQHASKASAASVARALQMGARAIELDVRLGDDNVVRVAHGNETMATTTSMLFSDALGTLKDKSFEKVDDPLLLFLELADPMSAELAKVVGSDLNKSVGGFIHRSVDAKPLNKTTLDELRGKILVFANSELPGLADITVPRSQWMNMGSEDPNGLKVHTGDRLSRIFPSAWFSPFSFNINAIPYLSRGYSCVAMNFEVHDDELYEYIGAFGPYSMMPKKI